MTALEFLNIICYIRSKHAELERIKREQQRKR